MTVQNRNSKDVYNGNGSTKVFPFTFDCKSAAHVHVYVGDDVTGSEEVNNFSVDLANKRVTYPITGDALPEGKKLTIIRKLPLQQGLDLVEHGPFFAESLEKALDELTMMVQQVDEVASRALTVAVSKTDGASTTVPWVPGSSIKVGGDGEGMESTLDPADVVPVVNALKAQVQEIKTQTQQIKDSIVAPSIDEETNHWQVNGEDTGVPATGPQGPQGPKGDPGDPCELPIASENRLGGIKVGTGLFMAEDGTLSATGSGGGGDCKFGGVLATKAALLNLAVTDLPHNCYAKVVTDESNQNKPTWYKLHKYRGWYWDEHEYTTSEAGRKFARHPSGMGTVMSMNDGVDRNILVLDAQYRTIANGVDFRLIEQTGLDLPEPYNGLQYGPRNSSDLNIDGKTDVFLNSNFDHVGGSEPKKFYSIDTNTSKTNTDNIIEEYATKGFDDTNTPVRWCRNQLVDGAECDLPNMNVLSRIIAEHTILDALDTTLDEFSSNGVTTNLTARNVMMCSTYGGYNNVNRYYGFAGTSGPATDIGYGVMSQGTNTYFYHKVTIPVLELPNGDGAEWIKVVDEPGLDSKLRLLPGYDEEEKQVLKNMYGTNSWETEL